MPSCQHEDALGDPQERWLEWRGPVLARLDQAVSVGCVGMGWSSLSLFTHVFCVFGGGW